MPQQTCTYYVNTVEMAQQRHDTTIVTVEVYTPHSANNPKLVRRILLYGAKFPVRVGQTVLVPPTQLQPKWSRGKIIATDATTKYRGKIKYVAPLGRHR